MERVQVPSVEEEEARRLHREREAAEERAHGASESITGVTGRPGDPPEARSRFSGAFGESVVVGRPQAFEKCCPI